MAGFQRLAHDRDIAGAVEGEVRAAIRQVLDGGNDLVGADLGGIDEVGHAELLRHLRWRD